MTSIVQTSRNLDEALARAARYEIEAKSWRIRSGEWRRKYEQADDEIADLKARLVLADKTATELIGLLDAVRAERDTWRACR